MKNADGSLTLQTDKGDFGPFDQVLFATGRVPLVDNLGLDLANIEQNARKMVIVDEQQQTNVEGVYAVGDVSRLVAWKEVIYLIKWLWL